MTAMLALDAGTGGAKCTVFDASGRLLATHAARWDYTVTAHRDVPFVKEYSFDPETFWRLLTDCARAALGASGVQPDDVLGVATTSQREGCVFLDAAGREVYAGPNLDSRGFMEGMEVLNHLGVERLYQITGHSAPFIFPLARYLWYRKHGGPPVAHILMINDWMTYRLTGARSSEPSNATESMLFDFRRRDWSAEILRAFDIAPALLAPVSDPGTQVGSVCAEAAAATGLRIGTPVFAGGADTQCALLGAGAVEPGDVAAILGTTTPVQCVVDRPLLDPQSNLWAGCHVAPGRWVIESNAGSTGDAYLWLLDLLVPEGGDRHGRAEALATPERDSGALTFIGPRVFDLTKIRPDMPGGLLFPFPTLQLRPSRGDLLRAFLESVAYAVRANLEQITTVTGTAPERVIVGGGMSRSRLLVQLIADATGLPVRRALEPENTGLGCAILVAQGAGVHSNVHAGVRAMCRHEDIAPDPNRRAAVERGFAKWRELYTRLEELSV
jgi:sugar (pentulose or hexulose) kinase